MRSNSEEISGYLSGKDFKPLAWVESNHPEIGHLWFALDRDALSQAQTVLKAELQESMAQIESTTQAKLGLEGQLSKLMEAEKTLVAERDQLRVARDERDALAQAQTVLKAELQESMGRIEIEVKHQAELIAERNELSKVKEKEISDFRYRHQEEIKQLKDQLQKAKNSYSELQKKIDQSIGKEANLQLEIQSLQSQLVIQTDVSTQLVQRNAELSHLQAQQVEAQGRQILMNEALLKSEAQIELIKDLCLREPGI
jgi:chromosome segregation ATPase